MFVINPDITIPDQEVTFTTMRAGGPGGQHVNKVESAVLLRFDIRSSSLPEEVQDRLLQFSDKRISSEGIIQIKVQATRSQLKNKEIALERLRTLILKATRVRKKRKATKPGKAAVQKRLEEKRKRSALKSQRGKPDITD